MSANNQSNYDYEKEKEIQKLILIQLNKKLPLTFFAEYLEEKTGGYFTLSQFKYHLYFFYKNSIPLKDLDELYQRMPLNLLKLSINSPKISLFSLFLYFSETLDYIIVSPLITLYKIAEYLYYTARVSPFEYIINLGMKKNDEFNIVVLSDKMKRGKIHLEKIDYITLFKCLDYHHKGTIKVEDLILVIETYVEYIQLKDKLENDQDLNGENVQGIFEKYLISTVFEKEKDKKQPIDNIIEKFIGIVQYFPDKEIVRSILHKFCNDKKIKEISFQELVDLLPKEKVKKSVKFPIRLSQFQKKNLTLFKSVIEKNSISTEKLIQYSSSSEGDNIKMDLFNLEKQIELQLSNYLSSNEIKCIIRSFDINKNGILSKEDFNLLLSNIDYISDGSLNNYINIYLSETQVPIFQIIPSKGNMKIIRKIQRELNRMINLWSIKKDKINKGELGSTSMKKEQNDNLIINLSTDKNANQPEDFLDYQDDYLIITSIEKVDIDFPFITCYDLISHLNQNKNETTLYNIQKSVVISQIVKLIDIDQDGFISGIDIISFLLNFLQYKSSKIAINYIKAKLQRCFQQPAKDFFSEQFENYNDKEIIHTEKVSSFLYTHFSIPPIVTKKMIKDFKSRNNPPYVMGDLVEEFENGNLDGMDNNYLEEAFKNVNYVTFENEISSIVSSLIDREDKTKIKNNSNELLIRKFNENLNTALKINKKEDDDNYEIDITYTTTEFKEHFLKPLHISMQLGMTIFNLLKKQTKYVTAQDIISLNDIRLFFISFLPPLTPPITIDEIIDMLERKGPSLIIALEEVPFNPTGFVAICEVMNILSSYYPLFDRSDIMKIIEQIDKNKLGLVSFEQLQMFLYENSKKDKFSYLLELKNIMSKLLSNNLIKGKSEEYFFSSSKEEFVRNYSNITKEEHEFLFKELNDNTATLSFFYDSILMKQGSTKGYNMKTLCDELNYFSDSIEVFPVDESILLPNVYVIEEILQKIHLGMNGKISIFELSRKLKENQRALFSKEIDKDKNGSLTLKELINQLRKIYSHEINISIHLISEYICYKNSFEGENKKEKIIQYIKEKLDVDLIYDTQIYKVEFFNTFKEDFLEDELLFEQFCSFYELKNGDDNIFIENYYYFLTGEDPHAYSLHQEKNKEKSQKRSEDDDEEDEVQVNRDLLSDKFNLYQNNSSFSKSESSFSRKNKRYVHDMDFSKDLLSKYENDIYRLRDIINMFTPKYIENNITIQIDYVETLFTKTLEQRMIKEEAKVMIEEFLDKEDPNYFDLKKFCHYVNETYPRSTFNINEDVLEKIKDFIMKSPTTSFRDFINTYFNKKYTLTFKEVIESFPKMFDIQLYECVLIFEQDNIFSIIDFFKKYNLTKLFPSESFDPSLNAPLKKIKDYFNSRANIERLFQKFDIDRNGELTYQEFINALFQCKDLNLTQKQIESIIRVADKNQDEKIVPAEFLNFLNTINDPEETKDEKKPGYLPPIKRMESIKPFESKIVKDIVLIKQNLLKNTETVNKNRSNKFLNYISILQEDLIKNYNTTLSMEYDFNVIDTNNDDLINKDSFRKILEKKLMTIEDKVYYKFVSLAEQGISSFQNIENKTSNKINYAVFLNNLINYCI